MIGQRWLLTLLAAVGFSAAMAGTTRAFDVADMARLTPGRTAAQNSLWIETPLERQFKSGAKVVVAEIPGPAEVTMIHFAMPQSHFGEPIRMLNRDLLLRAYWDGETSPSIDCPLVDFFCDPAGQHEPIHTLLVNKRRGFNAYFPMPFRKSARFELVYDGPVKPGDELWRLMPCYGYVMYRTMDSVPADTGYFHAHWRQEGVLMGIKDYLALDATGKGKFVGWNITVRSPGRSGYPVDQNENFYIDGATEPDIQFQGMEDSVGFSWGFPPTESMFALTGFWPYFQGAACYRFFINDAIHFEKSLKVTIGFGPHEDPIFKAMFSKRGTTLQFSTTCYWYQTEPHTPFPPMPSAVDRAPAPEEPFWPDKEELPAVEDLRKQGVKLRMHCGREPKEVILAEPGFSAKCLQGSSWTGFPLPVYHCRSHDELVKIELEVPTGSAGKVRVYVTDPDNFVGGRKQKIQVGKHDLGVVEAFGNGKWLEATVGADETSDGKLLIQASNARSGSNAVISIIEWVGSPAR